MTPASSVAPQHGQHADLRKQTAAARWYHIKANGGLQLIPYQLIDTLKDRRFFLQLHIQLMDSTNSESCYFQQIANRDALEYTFLQPITNFDPHFYIQTQIVFDFACTSFRIPIRLDMD